MPTVLVIDDEKDICQCVEDIFCEEAPDFTVLKADNGLDGIEMARQHKPDVILLDLDLCGSIDGFEVSQKIKEFHPTVKVALFTGHSGVEDEVIRELNVDAYVVKPIMPTEIVLLAKKLLDRKRNEENYG